MAAPLARLAAGGNTAANVGGQAAAAPEGDVDILLDSGCYLVVATDPAALAFRGPDVVVGLRLASRHMWQCTIYPPALHPSLFCRLANGPGVLDMALQGAAKHGLQAPATRHASIEASLCSLVSFVVPLLGTHAADFTAALAMMAPLPAPNGLRLR